LIEKNLLPNLPLGPERGRRVEGKKKKKGGTGVAKEK